MNETAILAWSRWHGMLVTLAAVLFLFGMIPAVGLGAVIAGSFFALAWLARTTLMALRPLGGYANWVGGLRLLLLLAAIAAEDLLTPLVCNLLLAVMISLDALDGFLARRQQQVSTFGRYLDMELDACFVLYACILLFQREAAGAWILVPGLLRYAYVILAWMAGPQVAGVDRKIPMARVIACVFFVVLILSLFLDHPLQHALLIFGSIGIVYSFGLSFLHLRTP